VVVLTTFNFGNKVMRSFDIWNNRVLELSNLCFKSVTPVEENYIIAAFFYQLVNFFWTQMNATTYDTIGINFNLIWVSKGNKFWTNLDL